MLELFSTRICNALSCEPIPSDVLSNALDLVSKPLTPTEAAESLAVLLPYIERHQQNDRYMLACAMIAEKMRITDGMLELWDDVRRLIPIDTLPMRMAMRWYRRERRIADGVQAVFQQYPDCRTDVEQATDALLGLSELKAYQEMDEMMSIVLSSFPHARPVRMRYIKCLVEQSRVSEAKRVADGIADRAKLGPASEALLRSVDDASKLISEVNFADGCDPTDLVVQTFGRSPRVFDVSSGIGPIVFYTGQLGTGGAERQMTRIASLLQERYLSNEPVSSDVIRSPVMVCVKHANRLNGSDFFLPQLRRKKVGVTILEELLDDQGVAATQEERLIDLLPADIAQSTRKLIPVFRQNNAQVAYLWQDGGVFNAAVAALAARVPRIVVSFRGLPPNLRPQLNRPQMRAMYQALAKLPQVRFSTNSQIAANEYEKWLDLEPGHVKVIWNATPTPCSEGSAEDEDTWGKICSMSPEATKSVLGIFRYDKNKRPGMWIDIARLYLETHGDTRFMICGGGFEFERCRTKVEKLGLSNKIFLLGVRENVGFFINNADVILHLPEMEGLPNALIEAHLAGKPVVATPAGGTCDVVAHGRTGFVLDSATEPNSQQVLKYLGTLLEDDAMRIEFGTAARIHAEPRFAEDNVLAQTLQLFKE